MLQEMSRRGIITMLFLMGVITFCHAQKFCNHLRMNQAFLTQNTIDNRTDTFDVLHYFIDASFLNYKKDKKIEAQATLQVKLKTEANQMRLDLLNLPVSAVSVNGQSASYTYSSPNLYINLVGASKDDTLQVSVSYAGNPSKDDQWGGFYFSGEYAFNLGVGFASDPHNFGRVWFPCFDNFTDRATYDFAITVDSGYSAYANGVLVNREISSDRKHTFRWEMKDPIPTYLASVAIAPYAEVTMEVDGIPVLLTAVISDTANLKKSFENLPKCIKQFQSVYGTHTFDRIGFNIVPFNAGAMEHATNIAYPRYAIANGDRTSETLYAHELAHHWWGNTTTCRTQEDMWLNEGWASYSERIFLEAVYGRASYNADIENNHHQVLQFAHVRDEDVLPVSGIGHKNTYGMHVYDKGADMVHTLRGLMGDDSFFEACRSFQQAYTFRDVSTSDLQSHFQQYTTLDLRGFFDEWIKSPGFAHFDILSAENQANGYAVTIKQTPRFNEQTYTHVKMPIAAWGMHGQRYDTAVVVNAQIETFVLDCPFEPLFWSLDPNDLISDATTTDHVFLKPSITQDLKHGMLKKVSLTTPADSVSLWVTHHWAPADGSWGVPAGAQISRERYWEVQGLWDENTVIQAQVIYSGLQTTAPDYGYLDSRLIGKSEDSLVLLYRPHGKAAWVEAPDYSKNMGSLFDKRGTIDIAQLKKGQYCLAMYDSELLRGASVVSNKGVSIFPNPASKLLNIVFDHAESGMLEITNLSGKLVYSKWMNGETKDHQVDISFLSSGTYFVGISVQGRAYDIRRVVVE